MLLILGFRHQDLFLLDLRIGLKKLERRFGRNEIHIWRIFGLVRKSYQGCEKVLIKVLVEDSEDSAAEDSDIISPSRKGKDSSVPWDLSTDKDGWPILPLELALSSKQLKEILRSFVTITYSETSPKFY